jgi:drug/metabolite transporter (DMT)-like permease
MSAAAFLFLITGVLLNAAAQLLLKGGTNRLGVITLNADNWASTLTRMAGEGYFVAGVAFYGVSLVVWILGLSRVPVSVAYPMLSLGYIVNAIAAHYLFGEAVTAQRWLGIAFIVAGVYLVARSA